MIIQREREKDKDFNGEESIGEERSGVERQLELS